MTLPFNLLRGNGRVVALGFVAAYLSSFGQTYFVAVFAPEIRAGFGLSHGGFGAIYSGATLVSGLAMVWVGSILDRVPAERYADAAFIGLAFGAVLLATAPNIALLALAIFLLRLFGQGMLGHVAVTSAARLAAGVRGRAVGVATLGFPLAEATMPAIALAALGAGGGLGLWWAVAALLLTVAALRIGLRRARDGRAAAAAASAPAHGASPPPPQPPQPPQPPSPPLTRRDLLRDWRFLALGPTIIGPSAVGTGFFFHQRLLADSQGWSDAVLAGGIAAWAAASVCAIFVTGLLVDRIGAIPLSRLHLLPMMAATAILPLADHPLVAPVFFGLGGLTMGAGTVVLPSMMAEIWGTSRLGTIRALAMSVTVGASALTPALFGVLVDGGVTLEAIAIGCAILLAAGAASNAGLAAALGRSRTP